ncbi:tRNA modification GTPase [Planctomycetaceae bacterium SH139]
MFDSNDTICAIASPPGAAPRGVVRISGPGTAELLRRILPPTTLAPQLAEEKSHAKVIDTQLDLGWPLGRIAATLLLWPDNRSYTGQPAAELHLLGAAPLLQQTLERLCSRGARLAQPGEFTLRAFLAGRLDLLQAEAVLGVIDAEDDAGLDAALDQLTGGISSPLDQLRSELINLLADLEAGLDFVDEDIEFISDAQLATRLAAIAETIHGTVTRMHSQRRGGELPLIALWGPANAGKSCLLNRLSGAESALVSAAAGTTRDPVEVRLQHQGQALRVVDTAGIERISDSGPLALKQDQAGTISQQAQSLGRAIVAQADVRLWCQVGSSAVGSAEQTLATAQSKLQQFLKSTRQVPQLAVATQSDLLEPDQRAALQANGWLVISSLANEGIEELFDAIVAEFSLATQEGTVAATAARCRESLQAAAAGLQAAAEVVRASGGHELVAAEMRLAIDAIGRVTGAVYTDDILDSIFSRFCIGK